MGYNLRGAREMNAQTTTEIRERHDSDERWRTYEHDNCWIDKWAECDKDRGILLDRLEAAEAELAECEVAIEELALEATTAEDLSEVLEVKLEGVSADYRTLGIVFEQMQIDFGKQADRIKDLEGALRPFTQTDLGEALGSNHQGDASPVFGRNKALLFLGDFRRALAILDPQENES